MRIVAGRHRGRVLAAPEGRDIRPTSDRLREALFNILAHGAPSLPEGARVLDVFAGTGALGIEALSRGAAHVAFVERDRRAAELIRRNLAILGEAGRGLIVAKDARAPGPATGEAADLAFLDPPYGEGLAEPALAALAAGNWLKAGARVLVELARGEDFSAPAGFAVEDERAWGKSRVVFLRFEG